MDGKDGSPRSDLDRLRDIEREEDRFHRAIQSRLDSDLRSWPQGASSTSSPASSKGPFERFKNFVDVNLGTFASGFNANVSELKSRMQEEREARRREELDISQRWSGRDDTPDFIRMQVDRQSDDDRHAVEDATYMLLKESYQRNRNVPPEKILALYNDTEYTPGFLDSFAEPMLSMGGACYYKTETVDNLPSTARWGRSKPPPQWLSVDWFKRSPYSPIRLESWSDEATVSDFDESHWRVAFEELLLTTLDKPIQPQFKFGMRPPFGKSESTQHGPGLDWMLSLQCRGILPPQLPGLYRDLRHATGGRADRTEAKTCMQAIETVLANRTNRYSSATRDIQSLLDEVAIKPAPSPCPFFVQEVTQAPQSLWRVPDTEEELYDNMPPYTDLVRPESVATPAMTGTRWLDRRNTENAVWAALDDRDFDTAADLLSAYTKVHEDIFDVLSEMLPLDSPSSTAGPGASTWYPRLMKTFAQQSPELLNKLSGVRWADRRNTEAALWAALDEADWATAIELLKSYAKLHDNIFDVLGEMLALDMPNLHEGERAPWYNKLITLLELQSPELLQSPGAAGSEPRARSSATTNSANASEEKLAHSFRSENGTLEKPDILSQLTTTQTTRMPDGTVTTKLVLKQRFADGREEVHESVQTSREEVSRVGQNNDVAKHEAAKVDGKKKQGWFWN